MSEKIYACLLHFYPAHFRKVYGDAALQLFRDRSRDETGFFSRLRLWMDLLNDLVISAPREHFRVRQASVGVAAEHGKDDAPTFYVSGHEAPPIGSLLYAGVLSLATFGLIPFSIAHGGAGRPPAQRPTSQNAPPALIQISAGGVKLDAAERERVINAVIKNVKQYYFDPHVAQEVADALLTHEKRGEYNTVGEGGAFADLLTGQIRDVSHDMHLDVVYSEDPLPDRPRAPAPEILARYRKALQQDNCAFEKVKILPQNIGYLKFNAFPDPSICQSTAKVAMASLNHVDAIIFDLRDNGGGSGSMVSLIASYLFDHPEFLYDPRVNPTLQSWTQPVPGNRLANKPAYILTSASTISAAEQFTYNLKMLKRVTLVGETTHGSAHAGGFHRIDDHFGMGIPRLKAINPFSKADWEGTGVEPDVKTKAADALETAEKLARSRLRKK